MRGWGVTQLISLKKSFFLKTGGGGERKSVLALDSLYLTHVNIYNVFFYV